MRIVTKQLIWLLHYPAETGVMKMADELMKNGGDETESPWIIF
jgi:hypothetical protein